MGSVKLWPDIKMAEDFLGRIAPDGEITFQTIDDQAKAQGLKNPKLRRVFHGSLHQHLASLIAYNNVGAGIYFMVNRGDGIRKGKARTCRTNANVVSVRALFVDLDGAPLKPVLCNEVPPSIVIESSPGRWHAYWITSDIALGDFSHLQLQIARKFNGDPSVKDLSRIMRLPGFWHQKQSPYLSHVIDMEFA